MSRRPAADRQVRAFLALLHLLPRGFREEYGSEMAAFFEARLYRARRDGGWKSVARLWRRTVWDVMRTGAAERFGSPGPSGVGDRTRSKSTSTGHGEGGMGSWIDDIKYGARRLARTPLFTIAGTLILAVGIGANTAAFTVVDAMLFRPPPFEDPERLVSIYQDSDDGEPSSSSFPAYEDMAARSDVFDGVAASSPATATWETADLTRQVSIQYATSSYMPVLGLSPSRGVWFGREHDDVGSAAVAVVSHRTWRTAMGADPGVVGSTIRLNGQPVTVIGIGPREFNGIEGALVTDFWLSISATLVGGPFQVANLERRQDHWYDVKARLAPDASVEQARAAMNALAAQLAAEFPELNEGRRITVFAHDEVRLHPAVDGTLTTVGLGLLAVVGLVLLLACSNLANLLLVRGVARSSEVAVRRALGASRVRIGRLFVVEALLLSMIGGLAGLLIARWAMDMLDGVSLPVRGDMTIDLAMDHRVLLFNLGLVLVTGVLFGLAPGLRSARADLAEALRDDQRSSSPGRGLAFMRNSLVTVQVAVSLTLLVGAGLLTRSLANMQDVDPGVDVGRIAVLGTNLQQGGLDREEWRPFVDELRERVAGLPGVESVALTSRLPVMGGGSTTTVVEGYEPTAGTGSVELNFAVVSPDYFETMGIDLVDGRGFSPADDADSPTVTIVNETAARLLWAGDAVGGRNRSQGAPDSWREVIGVVQDSKVRSLQEPPTPMLYFTSGQLTLGSFYVVVRTASDPASLTGPLRAELQSMDSSLPVTRIGPFEDHLGSTLSTSRTAATLMGLFSLLALLLATVGIYAVVSFSVARRSTELGIRIAMGATRPQVVAMVVRGTMVTVGVGILGGLLLLAVATPVLEALLFGVGTLDPATFVVGVAVLTAVGALAAYIPARRAAGHDPANVLRRA